MSKNNYITVRFTLCTERLERGVNNINFIIVLNGERREVSHRDIEFTISDPRTNDNGELLAMALERLKGTKGVKAIEIMDERLRKEPYVRIWTKLTDNHGIK
jgi:hypothetical protein